jgi:hypothetical protein
LRVRRCTAAFVPPQRTTNVKGVSKECNMLCRNCHRENDPDYRYCIFCGYPLRIVEKLHLSVVKKVTMQADSNCGKNWQIRLLVRINIHTRKNKKTNRRKSQSN